MRTAWRPTPQRLSEQLARATGERLTYADVGATAGAELPSGYATLVEPTDIGTGRASWAAVADGLLRWDLHRAAGMVLATSTPAVEVGCTVVNAAPFGPVALLAPCRVVRLIDEPERRGFAYGTLPGHPLVGEEEFVVHRADDDVVSLTIRSFSRPLGLAGIVPPLSLAGQRLVNRRYAAAARRLAR